MIRMEMVAGVQQWVSDMLPEPRNVIGPVEALYLVEAEDAEAEMIAQLEKESNQ